ncbi:MAG: alpha/beta hydrolase family protein, partial [Anaerolineae bacterium]
WRSDAPATLYWAEAQDGGNPRKKAEIRDHIYTLSAPFSGKPKFLTELGNRYSGIQWGNDKLALVSEWWWPTRKIRTWIIQPDAAKVTKDLLFDYSWQDRYNAPGNPMMKINSYGHSVLLTGNKGRTLYLTGSGASPEGDRPFLDELNLATKKTTRLWRSQAPYYEQPTRLLDVGKMRLLTRRESKKEPPNYFIRDLKKDQISQLTHFPHPTPALADVQKEMIRYERADGVTLTANLYLPPGYKPEDGPLPMFMWAYPREFKSAKAAAQVIGSPHRFVRVSPTSAIVWLAMGYAVLDGPTMPIIGEGDKEPNDTYVEQLVASAKAAVEEVVRRGVAEPGRIAIGGHSYGAFMTANLLAHSDLFSAGVARSGAYNRSLTPFGFQAEERTFWEAPEIYFAMSPFMHANKVNEPILLIHGEADNNSGTFPIQSKRFYAAIKGHGGKARLVMLPHESHGYRARESILHTLWETNRWLEKYVKNAPAKEKVTDKVKTSMN